MPNDELLPVDDNATLREDRVRSLVGEYFQRRESGEELTDVSLIANHLDLMPELGNELRKRRIVAAARDLASAPGTEVAHTVEHRPSKKDSRGLQICCPHCSNFVEVITDTPYEEICCDTCGSSFSLVDRDEMTRVAAPLQSIGRFDLVARLGVGGFGTVWKARDRELDRTVAVKIPRRGQLSPSEVDQFFREARSAAQLKHPNIVPVHEVGRDGETMFIVSDLVRGVTLNDWRTDNRKSHSDFVQICIPIASALNHAHQHGIVHRDLKPSNIMIDEEGQPHLTDFGLAKREVGEITMTLDGQILGTPAYMSPEQAAGQAHWTDRRTDIYSFGVILFELLTGELPFRGNAQMQVHHRLTEEAPDPRKLNPHISRDLATICWKCLEREPGRRYQTSLELADDLKLYNLGRPIKARAITPLERMVRWAGRRPLQAILAALVVFLAVAGPTVALIIEKQRQQLQNKVSENEHLILKRGEESREAAKRADAIKEQLDVWEGRANPWALWPPDSAHSPKQQQIASLLAARENDLEQGHPGETKEELAQRLLALAIVNEATHREDKAFDDFFAASKVLHELVLIHDQLHTEDVAVSLALADCYDSLSRLSATRQSRDESLDWLDKSLRLRRSLAEQHSADAELQALRLDAEMRSYTAAGFEKARQQLTEAQKIDAQLGNLWPRSATELYRLACLLAGRPAWLAGDSVNTPGTKAKVKGQ